MEDIERSFAGRKILVMEDSFLIGNQYSLALEARGAAVVRSNRPLAAGLIDRMKLDGAVLDIKLYGGTSEAAARALRIRSTPFVVVTAYPDEALPAAYGDAPCLRKPVADADLCDALLELMEQRSAAAAAPPPTATR